jgi:UDP-N-acetylglucosamine--N-acetylmuramyl-(pentapeptide) pyrophosphoryl-undecaprenol N-acetylglucosamine transferase
VARTWAIVAGGGTAGHVTPAIAIGHALVAAGVAPADVQFVGSARGIESRLVPAAGFSVTLLPGRGIERRISLANIAAIVGLVVAVVRGIAIVAARRPSVVVSVGGYASVPCAIGAVLLRVPLVLAEQNARPGAANRLMARFARASAVSFPDTPLPRAVVTGNPVRPEILSVDRARDRQAARGALGLPVDRWVIAVVGGSLGARRLNETVAAVVEKWADRSDLAIRHVVGARDWAAVSAFPAAPANGILWQRVHYEDRMELLYAAADVAVCRAGASTVFELAAVQLPAVLVPYPYATDDHQTANAQALAAAGGAAVVPDAELDADRLTSEIEAMISEPGRLTAMARAAGVFARADAAERVAGLVITHARRPLLPPTLSGGE